MQKFFLRSIVGVIFLTLSSSTFAAGTIELLKTLLTQSGGTWSAIADDNSEYRLVFTAPASNSNIGPISITRFSGTTTPQIASGSWVIVKVNNRTKYLINSTITSSTITSIPTGSYSMEIRTLGEIRLTFKNTRTGVHHRFFKVTSLEHSDSDLETTN